MLSHEWNQLVHQLANNNVYYQAIEPTTTFLEGNFYSFSQLDGIVREIPCVNTPILMREVANEVIAQHPACPYVVIYYDTPDDEGDIIRIMRFYPNPNYPDQKFIEELLDDHDNEDPKEDGYYEWVMSLECDHEECE